MATWKPIVVGVDGSDESTWAALLGATIAEKAKTDCHLVYGTHEVSAIPVTLPSPMAPVDIQALSEKLTAGARKHLEDALRGHVTAAALETLQVGSAIRRGCSGMRRAIWMRA